LLRLAAHCGHSNAAEFRMKEEESEPAFDRQTDRQTDTQTNN